MGLKSLGMGDGTHMMLGMKYQVKESGVFPNLCQYRIVSPVDPLNPMSGSGPKRLHILNIHQ